MDFIAVTLLTILQSISECQGATLKQQLEHIARREMESLGLPDNGTFSSRRYLSFHPGQKSLILGVPSMPNHLPEAEPILPGHTLIRPAVGMLKSAVKFPHKEWDDGAGVYGNLDNLGVSWDGTSDRVLYSGFRRTGNNYKSMHHRNKPQDLIIILLNNRNNKKRSRPTVLSQSREDVIFIPSRIPRRHYPAMVHEIKDVSQDSEDLNFLNNKNPNSKNAWFWNTKNAYDHIKFNAEAPKWTDLMPAIPKSDEKQWEYFL